MTTPERDPQQRPEDRTVPADAADTLTSTDRTAPSDGKPLYAEQDLQQAGQLGTAATATTAATGTRDSRSEPSAASLSGTSHSAANSTATAESAEVEHAGKRGEVRTITYSAETGGVQVVQDDPVHTHSGQEREEGGVLDSLKETLLSRTEGLRQRGGQLANTARLKMEVMSYSRDLESLYARLGRAYHHRADGEILAVIEQEIVQVERDIALRERQLESQDVSRELQVQRARAERRQPAVNLPEPTVPGVVGGFGVEERPPRTEHHLETEKRDTFFGLDKGGVDQQTTVSGGNAAFDTQIEPEDSVVSLDDLEKADNR